MYTIRLLALTEDRGYVELDVIRARGMKIQEAEEELKGRAAEKSDVCEIRIENTKGVEVQRYWAN